VIEILSYHPDIRWSNLDPMQDNMWIEDKNVPVFN